MANDPNDPYAEALISDPYESAKIGEIPKTENLLQRSIKAAQAFGGGVSSFNRGFTDTFTMGGTKLARFAADKMTGASPEFIKERDKVDNPAAYGVGAALPIAEAGVSLAKAGGKGISELFSANAARKKVADVAFSGAEEAQNAMSSAQDEATQAFGEGLGKLPPVVSGSVLAQAARSAADEMKVSNIAGHPLLREADRLESLGNNPMTGREVQMQVKNLMGKVSDTATRSTLYQKIMDVLPESHKAVKSAYAPLFNIMEQGGKLTKSALTRVGLNSGTMGDLELSGLKQAEDTLGLNLLQKAMKAGKNLQDVKRNAGIASIIGKGALLGAGGGSSYELIHHIFGGEK